MNYARIYARFIENRRRQRPSENEYTERHHILPVSLGGDNHPENLITLTAGDHYFAHLCLAKIYGGSMWAALWATAGMTANRNRVKVFSARRMVEASRAKMGTAISKRKKGIPQPKVRGARNGMSDPIVRAKHAETMRSPEYRKKLSDIQKQLVQDAEFIKKRGAAIAASWADPEKRLRRAAVFESDIFKASQAEKASKAWDRNEYKIAHQRAMMSPEAQEKMRDPKHSKTKSDAGKMRAAAARYYGFKYHELPAGKVAEYKIAMQGVSL